MIAADGSYTYDPNSIPDLENLSLGTTSKPSATRSADGHGDYGRLDADDHGDTSTPETVTAVADTGDGQTSDATITRQRSGERPQCAADDQSTLHVTTTRQPDGQRSAAPGDGGGRQLHLRPEQHPDLETLALGTTPKPSATRSADGHGDYGRLDADDHGDHVTPETVTAVADTSAVGRRRDDHAASVLANDLSARRTINRRCM